MLLILLALALPAVILVRGSEPPLEDLAARILSLPAGAERSAILASLSGRAAAASSPAISIVCAPPPVVPPRSTTAADAVIVTKEEIAPPGGAGGVVAAPAVELASFLETEGRVGHALRRRKGERGAQMSLSAADDGNAAAAAAARLAADLSSGAVGGAASVSDPEATAAAAASSSASLAASLATGGNRSALPMSCTCEDYDCVCEKRCSCDILGDNGQRVTPENSTLVRASGAALGTVQFAPYTFHCGCDFLVDESDAAFDSLACACATSSCSCKRKCACLPPAGSA